MVNNNPDVHPCCEQSRVRWIWIEIEIGDFNDPDVTTPIVVTGLWDGSGSESNIGDLNDPDVKPIVVTVVWDGSESKSNIEYFNDPGAILVWSHWCEKAVIRNGISVILTINDP